MYENKRTVLAYSRGGGGHNIVKKITLKPTQIDLLMVVKYFFKYYIRYMTTKLYNTCEYTCICTKRRKFIWWLQNKKKIISKLISQYTCSLNDEN